ncbi:MAG: hypothetical protein ACT4PT_04990 [Methanobacteriota archaeon]
MTRRFPRLIPGDVLDQTLRRRVLAEVDAEPGVTVNALAARLRIDYKTARHHADVLLRAGLTDGVGRGRRLHLFSRASGRDAWERRALVALAGPVSRKVLGEVVLRPGSSPARLVARTGASRSSVAHAIGALAAAGLVRIEPGLRGTRLYVDDRAAPFLPSAGPSPGPPHA